MHVAFWGMRVTVMPNETAKVTYFIFRSISIFVSTVHVPTPTLKVNFVFINTELVFAVLREQFQIKIAQNISLINVKNLFCQKIYH